MRQSNWKNWCSQVQVAQTGVYIVGFDKGLKIGYTGKPWVRFSEMELQGVNVRYHAWYPTLCARHTEKQIHELFAAYRLTFWRPGLDALGNGVDDKHTGEVFDISADEAIAEIERSLGLISAFDESDETYLGRLNSWRSGRGVTNSQRRDWASDEFFPMFLPIYLEKGPNSAENWSKYFKKEDIRYQTGMTLGPSYTETTFNTVAHNRGLPYSWFRSKKFHSSVESIGISKLLRNSYRADCIFG